MISDLVYTSKDLILTNQVSSKLMYLSDLKVIDIYTRGFCYLVNILTQTESIITTIILTKLTSKQKKNLNCAWLTFYP